MRSQVLHHAAQGAVFITIKLLLLAGYARFEAIMTLMELPAGYTRSELS